MYQTIVVGCGSRGRDHIHAVQGVRQLQLAGVVDSDSTVLQRTMTEHRVAGWTLLEDAMTRTAPQVVVLATHAGARASLCKTAARFDCVKAIVLEKPMATSLEEAHELVTLCQDRKILLLVSHQLRFCPEFVAARKAIEQNQLGRVTHLRGNCYGNLLNQGPHIIDAVTWLVGGKKPLWVSSRATVDPYLLQRFTPARNPMREDSSHAAPGSMTHTIEFEGGVRADLETGLLYQRSESFVDDWLQKRITITGTEGMAECQAAGHFKLLTRNSPNWKFDTGDIANYQSATRLFYVELASSLQDGVPHRCVATDGLAGMEILTACAQSALDGRTVSWPLRARPDVLKELQEFSRAPQQRISESTIPDRPSRADSSGRCRICVISPVPDHRGHLLDCLDSWVHQKGIGADQYQIIFVADGKEPGLEEELRGRLRPQDRLLQLASDNETKLYDLAIRETECEWVLLTEPHCIAEPFCLQQLLKYLDDTGLDGACLRSIPGNDANRFARQEHRAYREGFQFWSLEGDWRKVILRGLAMRRKDYIEVGGFECEFGRFAEWALAAALHKHGTRLGYASGSAVIHYDNDNFGDLFPPVYDFARGECAYRDHHAQEYCDRYFGCPPEWQMRSGFDRKGAKDSFRLAWKYFWRKARRGQLRNLQSATALLGTMIRHVPTVLFGPRYQAGLAYAKMMFARSLVRLPTFSEERLYRRFQRLYLAMVHYARIDYLTSQSNPATVSNSAAAKPVSAINTYEPGTMCAGDLVGFHVAETWKGKGFRWSEPVAQIRLAEPPGDLEITLQTHAVREIARGAQPELYWNGRRIDKSRKSMGTDCIIVRVDRADCKAYGIQRLGIACHPLKRKEVSPNETRNLGLPVFQVRVKRLDAA